MAFYVVVLLFFLQSGIGFYGDAFFLVPNLGTFREVWAQRLNFVRVDAPIRPRASRKCTVTRYSAATVTFAHI